MCWIFLWPRYWLDCPHVVAVVGELVSGRVAEHVGMHRESKTGVLSCPGDNLSDRRVGQGTTPFCDEDIRRVRKLPSQSPQRSNLRPSEWVHRRDTVLQAVDVETAVAEVNHVPLQSNDFRDTESMPVNDQDERSVAVSVSPGLACSLHQNFDFFPGQVFTRPHIRVFRLARRQLSRK